MDERIARISGLRLGCVLAATAMVSACGGGSTGGGAISTPGPAPAPTPAPTPAPAPTPTPSASYDTAEFRKSTGPAFHGAQTAWLAGSTGRGAKIAIIDTGIDTDSPEFAGRIDPASSDVAGNGTVEAFDDHGTQVALFAAAAKNDSGVLGIAYDATILALRADKPGSCSNTSAADGAAGCAFADRDIASGIDRAVSAGATVINISLGGETPSAALLDSVRRASSAGVVIVVAAGNEGDGSAAGIDPNQPNPFASAVRGAGGTNVIIVGAVDSAGQLAPFSNKAGSEAAWYLSALGRRLCCVYKDGRILVQTDASGSFETLVSGTSFSTPQVAGAVALLKQAFPNLTGAQMVDLLLKSARDAGTAGTDAVYGRGILDITAAFAPRGATALAGSTEIVRLGDTTGSTSPAMGDAAAGQRIAGVVLDEYERAYTADLAHGLRTGSLQPRLLTAVDRGTRQIGGAGGPLALAFTVADGARAGQARIAPLRLSHDDAEGARVLAARIALKLAPGRQIAFAWRETAEGLVAQMQGHDRPAFEIAGNASGDAGFALRGDTSLAYRQELGPWGLTASATSGDVSLRDWRLRGGALDRLRERHDARSLSLAADRRFGALETALGLTWMGEDRTLLGGMFAGAIGARGADSLFVDASAGWRFAGGWRLGGALRGGRTWADAAGLVGNGSRFDSLAWSADLTRAGVFGVGDTLGFRVSQPLRVESGGLALTVPTGWDYATRTATMGTRLFTLSPTGREIDGELAWHGPLWGGDAGASVFYRRDPGHIAALPDDKGVAARWTRRF